MNYDNSNIFLGEHKVSAIKLPSKSQHPILQVGLINQTTPIKSLPKGNAGVNAGVNILSNRLDQKYPQYP